MAIRKPFLWSVTKKCLDVFFIKRFYCQSFSYCLAPDFQLKSIAIHRTIVLLMFSRGFQNTLYDSWLVLFVPNSWAVNGIVKLKHIRKARLFSFSLPTLISREQSWWKVYAHYLCGPHRNLSVSVCLSRLFRDILLFLSDSVLTPCFSSGRLASIYCYGYAFISTYI